MVFRIIGTQALLYDAPHPDAPGRVVYGTDLLEKISDLGDSWWEVEVVTPGAAERRKGFVRSILLTEVTSTGPGLVEALGLALTGWRPRASQGRGTESVFGAAGSRDVRLDGETRSLLTSPLVGRAAVLTDPMDRMFNTAFGRQAANAVGNETRTLSAVERLSVEIMAQSLRITGQAGAVDRQLVVSGQPGRPPVLMLMSPDIASIDQGRIVSDEFDLPFQLLLKGLGDAADPNETTPEATVVREVLRGGEAALAQIFLISQPEIVLTRRPRMIPLSVPSPHLRIESSETVSTAGVFCRDADGDLGVTACYHGTGAVGTELSVGSQQSAVKRASQVQDIVFIPLPKGFKAPPMVGLAGVQAENEPGRSAHAHFDGATNQNRRTRILSTDAGLLRARPTVQLKLQTDPDTDQGDSGSALRDEHDTVLGFAFERTSYDDHPQFTDWIWAANALRALDLVPYKGGS